jgi:hypothetical protein
LPIPDLRFESIALDFGDLPLSLDGFDRFIVIQDCHALSGGTVMLQQAWNGMESFGRDVDLKCKEKNLLEEMST